MEKLYDNRFLDDDFEDWLGYCLENTGDFREGYDEACFVFRESIRELLALPPAYSESCLFSDPVMHYSKDKGVWSVPIALPQILQEMFGSEHVSLEWIKDQVRFDLHEYADESTYNKYIAGSGEAVIIDDSDYDSETAEDEDVDERSGLSEMLMDNVEILVGHLNDAMNEYPCLFERYPNMDPGEIFDHLIEKEEKDLIEMGIDELDDAIARVEEYIEEFESYIDDVENCLNEMGGAEASLRDIVSYSHWRRFPNDYKGDVYTEFTGDYTELLDALGISTEYKESIREFKSSVAEYGAANVYKNGEYFSPEYDPNRLRELIKSITHVMDHIGGLVAPKRKVDDVEYNHHIKKRRLDSKSLDEIRAQQTCTGLVFDSFNFAQLVAEIGHDFKTDLHWEPETFSAIQYAAEDFLVTLFNDAKRAAVSSGRKDIIEWNDFKPLVVTNPTEFWRD